ncbi:MAG TPA: 3-hydroxyacyl-ACP dehydratase FabZ family protein [Thermoguttaceae bacterium]|nr:3-hydroxyacyl-ACP dehydratase FabZ family protein [Thermoguttaceae bacterium]
MRWYWIDRFIEFESGRSAKAVKTISLAEDHLHDHYSNHPMIPNSLVIEGLAQTGGLLICEYKQFAERVVLAKIPKARFYCEAIPGDRLIYSTTIEYIKREGAMVTATSYKENELHAEAEIVFAHLDDSRHDSLFEPETFLRMMRLLGAFDVGRAADGGPLVPPKRLLEAIDAKDRNVPESVSRGTRL